MSPPPGSLGARHHHEGHIVTVKLIGITQPVIEGVSSPQELLAYCARVSNAANQLNHETGPKLIKRLLTHKEWSPLEMVSLTMEITTTRDISRQILRHRSFSFQEFSLRYSLPNELPELRQARDQHPTDRQMSMPCDSASAQDDWNRAQKRIWTNALEAYFAAVKRGMAKEVARAVLPEGLNTTKIYMAGNLRSWYHYCALRMGPETQQEHQLIARLAFDILVQHFPVLYEAHLACID